MAKDSKAESLPQLCSIDLPRIQTSCVKTNVDHQEIQENLALTVKTTLLSHCTKRKSREQLKEQWYQEAARAQQPKHEQLQEEPCIQLGNRWDLQGLNDEQTTTRAVCMANTPLLRLFITEMTEASHVWQQDSTLSLKHRAPDAQN